MISEMYLPFTVFLAGLYNTIRKSTVLRICEMLTTISHIITAME
jgi:hypothetical protein